MFEPKIVTRQIVIDISANPLRIATIPEPDRVFPDCCCRLIHRTWELEVPGQFTEAEAKLIQAITKDWNFSVDKNRKPRYAARLLQLLEQISTPTSSNQEVAA